MIFVVGAGLGRTLLGWLGHRGTPDLEWARKVDKENSTGHSFSKALLVSARSDGDQTLLLVETNSKVPGEERAWLLWLDRNGKVLREKVYGASLGASGLALAPAPEDGTFLVGDRQVSRNTFQGWVLRLDAAGEVLWEKTLGRPGLTGLETARALADGGVVVGGAQQSVGYIARLDPNGDMVWEKELPEQRRVSAVVPLADGSLVLGCRTEISTTGPGRSSVLALRADGTMLWKTDLSSQGKIDLKAAAGLASGDVLIAGRRASVDGKDDAAWLARLGAAAGQIVWQHSLGEPGESTDVSDLLALPALGQQEAEHPKEAEALLLVSAVRMGERIERHRAVVALGTNGSVLWQKRWGGSDTDYTAALARRTDGSLVVAGSFQRAGQVGKTQAALWQLDAEGAILSEHIHDLP